MGDVASKVIPRVIAGGYGAQMGAQVPEAARQAGTLSVTGTPQEKMEADLGLAGNVVLPGFLASPSTVSRVTRLFPRTLPRLLNMNRRPSRQRAPAIHFYKVPMLWSSRQTGGGGRTGFPVKMLLLLYRANAMPHRRHWPAIASSKGSPSNQHRGGHRKSFRQRKRRHRPS